jgi:hypothetical protein
MTLVRFVTRRRTYTEPRGTLYFDADCGICSLTARMLLCMQAANPFGPGFRLKANSVAEAEAKADPKRLEQAVLWVDAAGRQVWAGKAIAAVLRTFPFATPLAWLAGSGPGERLYEKIATNRIAISSFLGLGACGIARTPEPFAAVEPFRVKLAHWGRRAHGAAFVFMFVVFVCQVLANNRSIPEPLRIRERPFWVEWPVEYLHFIQGWRMFDESPRTDFTVVVRAVTIDGRRVDPLSERASTDAAPGASSIPERLAQNEFFCDYISKIAEDARYHAPLRDWIFAYPNRTGRPNDTIVSFQAVLVSDVSPAMGAPPQPTNTTERVFLQLP